MNHYVFTFLLVLSLIIIGAGNDPAQGRPAPDEFPLRVGPPVARGVAPAGPPRFIVKFSDSSTGPSDAQIDAALPGAQRVRSFAIGPARYEAVVTAPGADPAAAKRALRSLRGVEWVEPDRVRFAQELVPDDPYYQYQWHFQAAAPGSIHLGKAWDQVAGKTYNQVVVAVIDTGITFETYRRFVISPDFTPDRFVSPWNFLLGTTHANDDNGHGTHVSGTIAEQTDNGYGVAGMAGLIPSVKLMPLKVLNSQGSGYDSDVAAAVVYAADHGADLINLSLGSAGASQTLTDALAYAASHDVLSFCAAGNDYQNGNPVNYPAADPNCTAVGAVDWGAARAPYSETGPYVDLVAPGGNFDKDENGDGYVDGVLQLTIDPNNPSSFGYYFYEGTSMATPHATGAAAVLMSIGPADGSATRELLLSTARDLGAPGRDDEYGEGLIDLGAALAQRSEIAANSYYDDVAPFISSDRTEFYLVSNRPDDKGGKKFRLWMMERDPVSLAYGAPTLLPLFSPAEEAAWFPNGYGLWSVALSPDGQEIYVTVGAGSTTEVWYGTRPDPGSAWSSLNQLPLTMEDASFAGTSLSGDGLTLWFSSNRPCPGCGGDFNLWRATRLAGSGPESFTIDPDSPALLANVNTLPPGPAPTGYNEVFPAVSPDGLTLAFTSDAGSIPGSTLETSLLVATRPTTADSFGAPFTPAAVADTPGSFINSFFDDDGEGLYFAANLPGGQGQDLYVTYLDHGSWSGTGPLPVTGSPPLVCGVIPVRGASSWTIALGLLLPLALLIPAELLLKRRR